MKKKINTKKPPQPARLPSSQAVQLAKPLVDAWRDTVLELGRLPRGVRPSEHTPDARLMALTKQEAGAVGDLWEIFTQERRELSRHLLSGKREAVAYLLGFHLPNAARTELLLARADERTGFAKVLRQLAGAAEPLVWHDLGCGTGAVAQAAAQFLQGKGLAPGHLRLHLYDATGTLLDAARALFRHAGLEDRVQTHRVALEALQTARLLPEPGSGVTAYSLGYVWNELARNPPARARLTRLFEDLAAATDAPSLVTVLEPATQALCRSAMELRDELVGRGFVPLYPCPAATPCPMLELTRDWCYSEGDWARPRSVEALDRHLRIDRSRISGTLFLFASPALARQLTVPPREVVVGRPERVDARATRTSFGFDFLVCAGDELNKVAPSPGKAFRLRGQPLDG